MSALTREECLKVFTKHGFTEEAIVNMIVIVSGAKAGSLLEMKGLPMTSYLDTGLNIVYKGGKRYGKLEEAIKAFAYM